MSFSSDEDVAQNRTERRRLESEMFMLEGDKDRHKRRHEEILVDLKRLKTEASRLRVTLEEKEAQALAAAREVTLAETEILKVKRKMNSL